MPFDIFEDLLKYLVKRDNNNIIFFREAFGNNISEVSPAQYLILVFEIPNAHMLMALLLNANFL
jgi:hypothetical protein